MKLKRHLLQYVHGRGGVVPCSKSGRGRVRDERARDRDAVAVAALDRAGDHGRRLEATRAEHRFDTFCLTARIGRLIPDPEPPARSLPPPAEAALRATS